MSDISPVDRNRPVSLGPINSGNFDGAPAYRLNRECALLAASSPYAPPDCAD